MRSFATIFAVIAAAAALAGPAAARPADVRPATAAGAHTCPIPPAVRASWARPARAGGGGVPPMVLAGTAAGVLVTGAATVLYARRRHSRYIRSRPKSLAAGM
jgi:hypothetical protein